MQLLLHFKKEKNMRLNKFLSDAGYCSRREADRLTQQGLVTIDGRRAVFGDQVQEGQEVCVKGKPVKPRSADVLLAFHKPRGVECTSQKKVKNNIVDYINYPLRIYPVGRLDKDSQGLILMTNQGDIVNKIMRSGNAHEKEYVVRVNREITQEFLDHMAGGVPILDTVTRPCRVVKTGKKTFRIILTQGLNRQIRRMCQYLGYEVVTLKRLRIMNIELGDLKPGEYREVTKAEKQVLFAMIENSSNTPVRWEGDAEAQKRAGRGRSERNGYPYGK